MIGKEFSFISIVVLECDFGTEVNLYSEPAAILRSADKTPQNNHHKH